jgi:hypothetical protein
LLISLSILFAITSAKIKDVSGPMHNPTLCLSLQFRTSVSMKSADLYALASLFVFTKLCHLVWSEIDILKNFFAFSFPTIAQVIECVYIVG